MLNLKFLKKWENAEMNVEYSSNDGNNSISTKDSIMRKMIWVSLDIATLLGIWRYLIFPLFT